MRLKSLEETVARQSYYGVSVPTLQSQQSHHVTMNVPMQSTASPCPCTAAGPAFPVNDVPPGDQPFRPAHANPLPKRLKSVPINRQPPVGLGNINMLIQENKDLLLTSPGIWPRLLPERQPLAQKSWPCVHP